MVGAVRRGARILRRLPRLSDYHGFLRGVFASARRLWLQVATARCRSLGSSPSDIGLSSSGDNALVAVGSFQPTVRSERIARDRAGMLLAGSPVRVTLSDQATSS